MKAIATSLALLLAVACAGLWWQHRTHADLESRFETAQRDALIADFEASAARAQVTIVTHFVDRVRVVHDAVVTIQKDIPRYVTPDADRRFPLSVGFVRMHDAAVAGVPLGDGPGAADATGSEIAPSDAASVIAGNYGVCHETAEQLTALQDFVRSLERPVP